MHGPSNTGPRAFLGPFESDDEPLDDDGDELDDAGEEDEDDEGRLWDRLADFEALEDERELGGEA
jgi:hypothetical protein